MTAESSPGTAVEAHRTQPLRAQLALCCLIAFLSAWLTAYAPEQSRFIIFALMAVICGTLLDVPANLPLGRLAAYCLLIEGGLLAGVLGWVSVYDWDGGAGLGLAVSSVGLGLVAYPLLVVCCIARPATIDLAGRLFAFARLAHESGFRLGPVAKLVLIGIMGVAGIGLTDLPALFRSIIEGAN